MSPIVDIHTHIYPPSYISLLRSRTTVPLIRTINSSDRLIILPDEASSSSISAGRPVGPSYWDINVKLAFMDQHKIDVSVVSLANPWLDFLGKEEAAEAAKAVNDEIEEICTGEGREGRLFAFGVLPVAGTVEDVVAEIWRLKALKHVRGVILGTSGLGKGLDDQKMEPVWKALEESQTTVFLHPHYGLPGDVYGERGGEYGHVLPLALGFPLETTISISRLFLSHAFDRYPNLRLLLAHSGGTLPFLAGRIHSCILHDAHLQTQNSAPKRDIWTVLKENLILDAVVYGKVGLKAAVEVAGEGRVMFGTDHPFFPPLEGEGGREGEGQWESVSMNYRAIRETFEVEGSEKEQKVAKGILGGNAVKILGLDV